MGTKENERIIDESVLADINVDFERWAEFLNAGIGILSFSFVLSCLGIDHPGVTAFASLIFLLFLSIYGNNKFPKKLRESRKAKLPELDSLTLDGIGKKYFCFWPIFRYFLFISSAGLHLSSLRATVSYLAPVHFNRRSASSHPSPHYSTCGSKVRSLCVRSQWLYLPTTDNPSLGCSCRRLVVIVTEN